MSSIKGRITHVCVQVEFNLRKLVLSEALGASRGLGSFGARHGGLEPRRGACVFEFNLPVSRPQCTEP